MQSIKEPGKLETQKSGAVYETAANFSAAALAGPFFPYVDQHDWVAGTATETRFGVLVFSKTTAFRHDSIPDGIAVLGAEHGFAVGVTEHAALHLAPLDDLFWRGDRHRPSVDLIDGARSWYTAMATPSKGTPNPFPSTPRDRKRSPRARRVRARGERPR